MNMPLPQPVNPGKGPGDFYIQYPLKPGLTVMMVAYDGDYASNKLDLADSVAYPIDSVELLVSPSSLTVDSPLFKAAGADAETGSQKYLAESVPPNAQLAASLSGEAAAAKLRRAEPPAQPPAGREVKTLPNSMTRMGGLAARLLPAGSAVGTGRARHQGMAQVESSNRAPASCRRCWRRKWRTCLILIADLDELFAAGKITEKPYWKERLELKARLVAKLKKAPPALLESYAIRHTPR